MFEKLDTPEQAFNYQLGAALKMEHTVLDKILADSIEEAHSQSLKDLFQHHQDETRQQIANLEQSFSALGWDVDDSPCPTIEAIHKEGKLNVKKSDDSIVDSIILSGAAETEHHEIAVYESLITKAEAMGRQDVSALLRQNLEQEQHTLGEVKRSEAALAGVA